MESEEKRADKEGELQVIITSACQGDAAALSWLYQNYFPAIFRYIYWRIGSRVEAEDLTQVVFEKMLRSLPRFDNQQGSQSFTAWLFTIARNLLIDFYRRQRRELSWEEAADYCADNNNSPGSYLERQELLSWVQTALQGLTVEQQEVVWLRFVEGLSVRETAEIMDRSEEAIRALQYRALQRLRRQFKEWKKI